MPRGFLTASCSSPDSPKVNARAERPARAGRVAHQPAEPAHAAGDRQPRLAPPVRPGMVKTVDNFGVTGDVPSHPELLDHLAVAFIRDGWSVKKLVRTIVLSRAYQLGSERDGRICAVDPGQPARLAAQPASAGCRGDPRRDAGRRRAAGSGPARWAPRRRT